MFNFLKLLKEMSGDLPTTGTNIPSTVPVYNGTNGTTPTAPSNAKVSGSTDPSFNNSRATLANGEVTAASVTDYVNQAAEINDGIECVGFAVELDDGKLVKVYVNQTDAEGFETALSDALGQGDELEDLLVNMADTFDIVDVVWPTPEASSEDTTATVGVSQSPTDTASTEQIPTDASTSADAVISQPETVAPDSTSAAPASDAAGDSDGTTGEDTGEDTGEKTQNPETGDGSGGGGSLSDAEAEFNSLYGDDTGSNTETDTTDKKSSAEDTSSTDTSSENATSDETSSAGDTGSEPEPEPTDTGSEKTGEMASTEGEGSDNKDKKSKSNDDDDISVVIHPKKTAVAEGVEDQTTPIEDETTPVDTAPIKESKWFKSIGLRGYDEFAMMISGITAKKLLAILGFGGVRAAMLSQYDGLVENLITTGKKINSNPTSKKFFETVWGELMAGSHHKSPDAENVELAQEFLVNIGIVADEKTAGGRKIKELEQFLAGVMKNSEVKIAIQGLNAALTGEPQPDSSEPTTQKSVDDDQDSDGDDTHLDNFSDDEVDDHLEEGAGIDKQQKTKRTHASFDAEMKSQHSQYRKWMSRDQQVELLNWYLSGSDVHVFDWHPANGSITPHLGKLQIFAQGDLSTGEQEIICLEKPAYVISH